MENRKKKILFSLFILLLFAPIIQMNTNFFVFKPLKGAFELTKKPEFSDSLWFSKDFQIKYENYFNDNLGFRNLLVRLNNQIKFSFFNKSSVKSIIIGKEGYLFEKGYIDEFYGINYKINNKIKTRAKELKKIQDYLATKNITFIPVISTGKGSYFSEYIPDRYKRTNKKTYYSELIKNFNDEKLKYINLRKKFLKLKKTSKYPLYPKTGIHWTKLGAIIGVEEIIKYIEANSKFKLQKFKYNNNINYSDSIKVPDNDIGLAMNLIWEPDYYKIAYPKIKYEKTKSYDKINVLFIGDSYCYNILDTKIFQTIGNNVELWYYNKRISPPRKNNIKFKDFTNYKNELSKFNVIILLVSEANYYRFDLDLTNRFNSNRTITREISNCINIIKKNKTWYNSVTKQAKERNISIDSMLIRAANYHLNK